MCLAIWSALGVMAFGWAAFYLAATWPGGE